MTVMPVIDSRLAGPPPERHAARVVGDIVKWLAGEGARLSALRLRSTVLEKQVRQSNRATAPRRWVAAGCGKAREAFVPLVILFRLCARIVDDPALDSQASVWAMVLT